MKSCQRCSAQRLVDISAKCSDMFHAKAEKEHDGYVLRELGIGGGDYVEFTYCLECGQIQGKFPRGILDIEDKREKCTVCGEYCIEDCALGKYCIACGCMVKDIYV
jgi:hypothetical protein